MDTEKILFDGGGVTISLRALTVNGRSYSWRNDIGVINVSRRKKGFFGGKVIYELMLSPKGQIVPTPVFQTEDGELAERMEKAINQVGRSLGAVKEK